MYCIAADVPGIRIYVMNLYMSNGDFLMLIANAQKPHLTILFMNIPAINNYINKLSRVYIEQRNFW